MYRRRPVMIEDEVDFLDLILRPYEETSFIRIKFEREVYYPGETLCGSVFVSNEEPIDLHGLGGVELIVSGKSKCKWVSYDSEADDHGNLSWYDTPHGSKEVHFRTKIMLFGSKDEVVKNLASIPSGEKEYPFSVPLPLHLPTSHVGMYGGVIYCAKVKVFSYRSKQENRNYFKVRNFVDLNEVPQFNKEYRNELNKTFGCCCWLSSPLSVTLSLPRTAFVHSEDIPVTLEVQNESNVKVNSIKVGLHQVITWRATEDVKFEYYQLRYCIVGPVERNTSRSWTENLKLGSEQYKNTNCSVVNIGYELRIEVDAPGSKNELDMKIPLIIGDIPYGGKSPVMS